MTEPAPVRDHRCEVIAFPARRRLGKIRRTAEVLSTRNGRGADRYWKQVIDLMRAQMTMCGLPSDVVERGLRAFADEVFARIGNQPNDGSVA